jgi:hypothetical protein
MGRPISSGWFSREVPLNWNKWLRQIHRWLSIAFTATVIANFVAMGFGQPPPWVVYSPLLPLALLLFTGLYLFALPYAANWSSGRKEEKRA